jgi:UDP-glucose 4-epimerase
MTPGRMMKILVTGGAGFIGSNLVPHLAGAGHDVVVLDNLSVGREAPFFPSAVKFRHGDFLHGPTLAECLAGVDVVVHLAAMSGVMDSIADPARCFADNAEGTFRLLEAARRAEIKHFVNASTGGAILGEVVPPISEAMAPAPLSPYGASKLATEGFCSAYSASYGLPCVSLRFSNIYGPNSAHKKSVVAAYIKRVLDDQPLVIYGDGTQRRDYLFVGDLVRGIAAAIGRRVNGTFQLGSGRPASLLELIQALGAVAGRKLAIEREAARKGEVHSTWCDITKAREAFAYSAPTALAGGLRATWDWFAQHQGTWRRQKILTAAD